MELIKQWALGITIASIVGAIILIVTPQGSTQKVVKTAVSLFLLCTILMPVINGVNIDFLDDSINSNINTSEVTQVDNAVIETMKKSLEKRITAILENNGIKDAVINIDISIDENNNMIVNSCKIIVGYDDEMSLDKAKQLIREDLGIEVQTEVGK